MKVSIRAIKQMASARPEGYEQDVMSRSTVDGEFLEISPKDYMELLQKYQPNLKVTIKSLPPQGGCCGKDVSFPPVTQQAKNALTALGKVGNAILHGEKVKASDEVIQTRKSICMACGFWDNGRCKICGCYTAIKMTLETENCPKNKW